jgi:SpoIID/LytB domain protein
MTARIALLALLVALSAGAAAGQGTAPVTTTTFVFTGRGWGHGVGMGQYGALGMAKRGITYDKILAHFYRGTQLTPASVSRIRVLLAEGWRLVTIASPVPFRVRDGTGVVHELDAGRYRFGAGLLLKLAGTDLAQALPGPLRFLPGKAPLELGRRYRGVLDAVVRGKSLFVVNDVPLEAYIRGVVSDEMPEDWPLEAVKAQAVAARSYALSQRRTGGFDVYPDTRDQVYGGVSAETPVGDRSSAETKGQVLTYNGKVATTFFFSSSGGRTASVVDVFLGAKPTPYLVSVADPYDTISPYHTWGPVVLRATAVSRQLQIAGVSDLRPVPETGRASSVVITGKNGEFTLPASSVRRSLDLRSTWFRPGVLTLSASGTTLSGSVRNADGVVLEQRLLDGGWEQGPALELQPDGAFELAVAPEATTLYRLAVGEAKGAPVRVAVP